MKAFGALGTLAVAAMLAFAVLTGAISPRRLVGEVLREAGIENPISGMENPLEGVDLGSEASPSGPSAARGAPAPLSAADAQYTLEGLVVSEPGSMAGYSREEFAHWSNAYEFGWAVPDASCDVRDAALLRDGENVEVGAVNILAVGGGGRDTIQIGDSSSVAGGSYINIQGDGCDYRAGNDVLRAYVKSVAAAADVQMNGGLGTDTCQAISGGVVVRSDTDYVACEN